MCLLMENKKIFEKGHYSRVTLANLYPYFCQNGMLPENIVISITSTGNIGSDLISKRGEITFNFDLISNEYTTFEYIEQGEFNPLWGVLVRRGLMFLLRGAGGRTAATIALTATPAILYTPERIEPLPSTSDPIEPVKEWTETRLFTDGIKRECTTRINDPIYSSSCNIDENNVTTATLITAPIPEKTSIISFLGLVIFGVNRIFKRK